MLLLVKGNQYKFYYADNRLYAPSSNTKERGILGKELIGSNLAILNIQSDIVKKWREITEENNKILVSTTAFST